MTFDSDPHVIYDSLHGRWLATEVSWDCDTSFGDNGTGYIDFAVSRTADPTGTWDVSFIPFPNQLPDYPAPGTSSDKVGIGSNLYDMSATPDCLAAATFAGTATDILDWADLTNGGGSTYQELLLDAMTFTPRVAVQAPATSPTLQEILVGDAGLGAGPGVLYLTLVGSVVAGTLDLGALRDLTTTALSAPSPTRRSRTRPGQTRSTARSTCARPTRSGRTTGSCSCRPIHVEAHPTTASG